MNKREIYKKNRAWSDQFMPEVKEIVGYHLLEESSFEVDTQQAADLVVFSAKNLTIACRVRRHGYLSFKNEFTVRSKHDNGAKTELSKIVDGWGDWMFYGHDNGNGGLACWSILDLNSFRAHMIRNKGGIKMGNKSNGDGTHFCWFDMNSFKDNPKLIVAQGGF